MKFIDTVTKLSECGRHLKILYVEDEPQIRENTETLLSTIFSVVRTAENGKEGLALYEKDSFDIVISDILMPEMNGVKMIEKIKAVNPNQSIVVISACEDTKYILELINLGISHFILKPVNAEQMISVLYSVAETISNARKVAEFNENIKHELKHTSTLLDQYKEIVDVGSIVSKTDLYGRITYVNDQFCKISGYTREELLSKNHNIVRHPEMSPETFAEVWNTIQQNKIWQGTIKNKNKNGDYYITNTTIKPILDEYGNTIEYMSLRYDVTELYDLSEEILTTQHEILGLLGEIGETRSNETGHHVRRVAKYSRLLAELYGLDPKESDLLYRASPMHDIGKIGIPDAILLKPEKLEYEEFEVMKTHSEIGYQIFQSSERPLMRAAAIIAHEHHEKWDGTGYPSGLSGDNIHIYGRITALADVFDALSCARVYKTAWPLEKIIDLIREERGKHFDPVLVDLFMENIDKFIEISNQFKDQK